MAISLEKFEQWLHTQEKERLEFKEAKQQYDYSKLKECCIAIANEGGGYFVLGVSDKLPRNVVGTNAFQNLSSIKRDLLQDLGLRIETEEFKYNNKRVLIFEVPSRPIGVPLHYKGAYLMRVGDSLEPMTQDQLRKILSESQPDFSAVICPNASISDLDETAIEELKSLWSKKSNNPAILILSTEQLLSDADLLIDGQLNYAALILLGKSKALVKFLANSEIVFEYRNNETSIESQQRIDYRIGFLSIHNKIWERINLRNEVEHIRDGLFIRDIPNFNEDVVREALLNAVCHRDYTNQGSVFIRQYPKLLEIESPARLFEVQFFFSYTENTGRDS